MPRSTLLAIAAGLPWALLPAGCFSSAAEDLDGGATAAETGGTLGASGSASGSSSGASGAASSSATSTGGLQGDGTTGSSSTSSAGSSGGAVGGFSSGGFGDSATGTSGSSAGTGGANGTAGGVSGTVAGGASGGGSGTIAGGASGGSSGGGSGSSCEVPGTGQPDPCDDGLVCIGATPLSATGTCQLPTDGYPCDPSVGCAAGNSCVGQSGETYCYQQCTTTTDCAEAYETCQPAGVGPTGSLCIAETCSTFWAPCNVVGTGDGYCVPFADPPNPDYGLCLAGAPADAGLPSSCTSFGRAGGLCPVGMFCYTDYETTGTQCQPFCGAPGTGGPSCSGGGQLCVQYYGNLWGSCAPTCPLPDHQEDCPPQENCLVTGQTYPDGGPAYTCEP